jgi:hypothetical protein
VGKPGDGRTGNFFMDGSANVLGKLAEKVIN